MRSTRVRLRFNQRPTVRFSHHSKLGRRLFAGFAVDLMPSVLRRMRSQGFVTLPFLEPGNPLDDREVTLGDATIGKQLGVRTNSAGTFGRQQNPGGREV